MVAKHDLLQDIPELATQFEALLKDDPQFAALVKNYYELDRQVLEWEVEHGNSGEELNRLRRERVLAKDRIVRELQYPIG
nr:DUF465 domain-containing protein [uncultured Pseudomonas sp.]